MARMSESGRAASSFTTGAIGPAATPWKRDSPVRKYAYSSSSFHGIGARDSEVSAGASQPSANPPARWAFAMLRPERVARRMAGAAMAEAFDQIGAAIPDFGFGRVGLERIGLVEQRVPSRHQRAQIERERAACCSASPRAPPAAPSGKRRAPACRRRWSWRSACRETPDRDAGRRDEMPSRIARSKAG